MLNCQNALIAHLQAGFTTTQVKTIKGYAGELKKANHLTQLLPSILVIFNDGLPAAQEKEYQFDVLTIVENSILTKIESYNSNLDLVSDVARYLRENQVFVGNGKAGAYEIDRETMRARTLLNDDRFNVVAIETFIKDYGT